MRAIFYPTTYLQRPKRSVKLLLRQGLPPIEDPTLSMSERYYSAANRYGMKMRPDQTKGIYFQSTSGGNFTYRFDIGANGWSTDTNTTSAFAGEVNDCFTSNDYYGFVGQSTSYINVFKWADHSLVTLNKTGLGTVWRASIHPNGYSLAICHGTTPYLRVYDLRDGTYIEPSAANALAGQWSSCSWANGGNYIVAQCNTSPYLVKYDAALTTRTTLSTSASYTLNNSYIGSYQYNTGLYNMPHPTKADCVIMANPTNTTSTTTPMLYEVNAATNTITNIVMCDSVYNMCTGFAVDTLTNTLYAQFPTATAGTSSQPSFRAFDLTTYAAKTSQDQPLLAMGYTDESRPMIVVSKNYGQITGTVRDISNNPVARTVRAYRRSDGFLVAQTTSDGTTGDYTLIVPTADTEAYDVQFMTAAGELLNDLIFSRSTPTLVP